MLHRRYPVKRMSAFYAEADELLVGLKKDPTLSMTIVAKVQSYLTAGRPIIWMRACEGGDVIKRASAGLVYPAGDSAALAETIQRVAETSPKDRLQMGKQAQAYAKTEFDRNTFVTRLFTLLEESISLHQLKKIRKAQ